jgi:hypothetical protein
MANLSGVDLSGRKFSGQNLSGVNFSGADLSYTILSAANLFGCNLYRTKCINSKFFLSNLTGIIFKQTIVFDWNIKDVKCEYIFFDNEKKQRYPKDRNFEAGEFEKLYSFKPQIEFVFKNGLSWHDILAFGAIENKLSKEKPEFQAKLISIDKKGDIPRVIFEVASEQIKEMAEKEIKKRYEDTIEILKIESQRQYNIIQELLKQPRQLTVGRDYIQAQGDVLINNTEILNVIEEIKQIVKKENEKSFKGKSKNKILEYLDHTGKGLTKDGIKQLLIWAKDELLPLMPKLLTQVNTLENIWRAMGL